MYPDLTTAEMYCYQCKSVCPALIVQNSKRVQQLINFLKMYFWSAENRLDKLHGSLCSRWPSATACLGRCLKRSYKRTETFDRDLGAWIVSYKSRIHQCNHAMFWLSRMKELLNMWIALVSWKFGSDRLIDLFLLQETSVYGQYFVGSFLIHLARYCFNSQGYSFHKINLYSIWFQFLTALLFSGKSAAASNCLHQVWSSLQVLPLTQRYGPLSHKGLPCTSIDFSKLNCKYNVSIITLVSLSHVFAVWTCVSGQIAIPENWHVRLHSSQ